MKKTFLLAILSIATVLSLSAQQTSAQGGRGEHRGDMGARQAPTAQEMADKETTRQTKMLSLTPDQVAKAKVINLKYSQQRADLMASAKQAKDRTGMQDKMETIRTAQDTELKTILTADQQAKLTKAHENMEERKEERKENRGKGNRQKSESTPQKQ